MRFISLYTIAALLLSLASCAKDKIAGDWQGNTFIKHYGHVYNQTAYDIVQTPDHGYLILGSSSSYGDNMSSSNERTLQSRMYLVKTDSLGNELWSQSYGTNDTYVIGKKIIFSPDSSSIYLIGSARRIDFSMTVGTLKQTRVVITKVSSEGVEEITKYYPNNFDADGLDYEMESAIGTPDRIIILSTSNYIQPKAGSNPNGIGNELDKTDFQAFQLGYDLGGIRNRVTQGVFGEDRAVKILLHPNGQHYFVIYNSSDANNSSNTNTADNIFSSRINIYNITDNEVFATNTSDGQDGPNDNNFLATDASLDVINNQLILTVFVTQNLATDLLFTNNKQVGFKQYNVGYEDGIGITINRIPTTYPPIIGSDGSNQKSGNVLVYPNNNGYLTSSTVNTISNVNSDIQITRYDRNFQVLWSRYLGSGASMDKAGPLFFIDSTIANSNIRPIVGIGGIGTFDFGASNTMMGFFKANTQGELKANE